MDEIKIDTEFMELVPPMSVDEYRQLKSNIVRDGCREPISLWDGTIVDGHTRYRICKEEGISFSTVDISLKDREDAKKWIIMNQLGKRNLNPTQISLLRGMLYNNMKSGASRKGIKRNVKNPTADKIADQTGVSARTVREDAKLVEAIEKLEPICPELKKKVLAGEINRKTVIDAAKVFDSDADKARKILEGSEDAEVKEGSVAEAIRQAIYQAHSILKREIGEDSVKELSKEEKMDVAMCLEVLLVHLNKVKSLLNEASGTVEEQK